MGRIVYSLYIFFAIPPDALMKGSFLSMASTIWWPSFLFLFIAIMMSVTAALRRWSFIFVCCITNHCCFIIVVSPTVSICPLQGLYMAKIVVRELFFPKIVMKVHRPMPERSCPFCRTADETLFKVNIAVPPALQSEFHLISDSEVQKLILCFGHASLSVYLKLWWTWALSQWMFVSVIQTMSTLLSLSVKHSWSNEYPPLPSSRRLIFI